MPIAPSRLRRALTRTDTYTWAKWQLIKLRNRLMPASGNPSGVFDDIWAADQAPFRLAGRAKMAHSLLDPGQSVLEVGCGSGGFLRYLHGEGRKVLGIDYSPVAVRSLLDAGLGATVHDLTSQDPLPRGYDAVICLEVIEHFSDPWAIYEKLWQAAGHRVIISVPYKHRVPSPYHLYEFDYETLVGRLSRYGPVSFVGGHPTCIIASQTKP